MTTYVTPTVEFHPTKSQRIVITGMGGWDSVRWTSIDHFAMH